MINIRFSIHLKNRTKNSFEAGSGNCKKFSPSFHFISCFQIFAQEIVKQQKVFSPFHIQIFENRKHSENKAILL